MTNPFWVEAFRKRAQSRSHHVAQIRKDTIEALRIAKGVTTLRRHLEKPFDFQNGLRMNGRIGKVLQILLSIGTFRIPAPFSTLHNIRYRTLMITAVKRQM
jgi:hypothetical protein